MDITLLLARMWGPAVFAVGLGIFTSRSYYVKIYRDIEKDALAAFVFGVFAMIGGVAHVSAYNEWGTFLAGLISFFGWGLFVKGALFVVAPRWVERMGNFWVRKNLMAVSGLLCLIAGAYLMWAGYLS